MLDQENQTGPSIREKITAQFEAGTLSLDVLAGFLKKNDGTLDSNPETILQTWLGLNDVLDRDYLDVRSRADLESFESRLTQIMISDDLILHEYIFEKKAASNREDSKRFMDKYCLVGLEGMRLYFSVCREITNSKVELESDSTLQNNSELVMRLEKLKDVKNDVEKAIHAGSVNPKPSRLRRRGLMSWVKGKR